MPPSLRVKCGVWRRNAERGAEAQAAARARLTAAHDQFMAEGDPAKNSAAGEDLIRTIFGRAAIAEDCWLVTLSSRSPPRRRWW